METQNHTIKYQEEDVKITQYLCESNEQFEKRMEFIRKLEKDNIKWKDANKLSKIFYNVKFKNCRYTPVVYNMVKKYF